MRYVRLLVPVLSLLIFTAQSSAPRTHRLEATPATVAYGYYWSEAKPVLRIASGDIIDVDTLLTSTPDASKRPACRPRRCRRRCAPSSAR
jgi:hypothetical protein